MAMFDALRAYHKDISHAVQAVYDHGHADGKIDAADDLLGSMERELQAWTGEGLDACQRMHAIVAEYRSNLIVQQERKNDPSQ